MKRDINLSTSENWKQNTTRSSNALQSLYFVPGVWSNARLSGALLVTDRSLLVESPQEVWLPRTERVEANIKAPLPAKINLYVIRGLQPRITYQLIFKGGNTFRLAEHKSIGKK